MERRNRRRESLRTRKRTKSQMKRAVSSISWWGSLFTRALPMQVTTGVISTPREVTRSHPLRAKNGQKLNLIHGWSLMIVLSGTLPSTNSRRTALEVMESRAMRMLGAWEAPPMENQPTCSSMREGKRNLLRY